MSVEAGPGRAGYGKSTHETAWTIATVVTVVLFVIILVLSVGPQQRVNICTDARMEVEAYRTCESVGPPACIITVDHVVAARKASRKIETYCPKERP